MEWLVIEKRQRVTFSLFPLPDIPLYVVLWILFMSLAALPQTCNRQCFFLGTVIVHLSPSSCFITALSTKIGFWLHLLTYSMAVSSYLSSQADLHEILVLPILEREVPK